jgi:hypothetical protein
MVHSVLASMYAIVAFRVPRNVRDEARLGSHTAKTYSKHVGCAHVSVTCKRSILIPGRFVERFIGVVWSLYRALEALKIRSTRGTPHGCLIA